MTKLHFWGVAGTALFSLRRDRELRDSVWWVMPDDPSLAV